MIVKQKDFNDATKFTTIRNRTYFDTIILFRFTADTPSISRILYTIENGYIFCIAFYANYSKSESIHSDLSNYFTREGNVYLFNKNSQELRKKIINRETNIQELNLWIQETDDFLDAIEIVKQ
jgi:hypothetical protein